MKPTTLAGRSYTTKGRKPTPDQPPSREINIPTESKLTQAHTITEEEYNRKNYQRKPPTPPKYGKWALRTTSKPPPNTKQTLTLVCNAKKGIPFAIGKQCKTKNCKSIHTIGLEFYA